MHGIWPVEYSVWLGVTAALALGTLGSIIKLLFLGDAGKSAVEAMDTVNAQCASCGWRGDVPRIRRRCPMCGGNTFA
jgi:hypothetical protein